MNEKYNSLFVCQLNECKLFLENGVTLPCGNTICKSHLNKSHNFKLKCSFCLEEHFIPENGGYGINLIINELMNLNYHLNNSLQQEAQNALKCLRLLIKEYEDMTNKNKGLLINDYFDNVRNQVDIYREELKYKISTSSFDANEKQKLEHQIDQKSNHIIGQLYDKQAQSEMNSLKLKRNLYLDEKVEFWRQKLRIPDIGEHDLSDLINEMKYYVKLIKKEIKQYNDTLLVNESIEFHKSEKNNFSFGRLVKKNTQFLNSLKTDGQLINFNFNSHFKKIRSIQEIVNSNRLITISDDKLIKIWNYETYQCLNTLKDHKDCVTSIQIMTDNDRFLTGSMDKTIKIWNSNSLACIETLTNESSVLSLCLLTNNRLASGLANGTICIWDLSTNSIINLLNSDDKLANCLILTNDNTKLISSTKDGRLKLWDLEKFTFHKQFQAHLNEIHSLVINEDGCLFSGSHDNTIKKWCLENDECVNMKTKQFYNFSIECLNLIAYELVAVGISNGNILIYDFIEDKIIYNFNQQTSNISSIKLLSNGYLVSGSESGQMRLRMLDN
jgi:WD40 repeat protein